MKSTTAVIAYEDLRDAAYNDAAAVYSADFGRSVIAERKATLDQVNAALTLNPDCDFVVTLCQ